MNTSIMKVMRIWIYIDKFIDNEGTVRLREKSSKFTDATRTIFKHDNLKALTRHVFKLVPCTEANYTLFSRVRQSGEAESKIQHEDFEIVG